MNPKLKNFLENPSIKLRFSFYVTPKEKKHACLLEFTLEQVMIHSNCHFFFLTRLASLVLFTLYLFYDRPCNDTIAIDECVWSRNTKTSIVRHGMRYSEG